MKIAFVSQPFYDISFPSPKDALAIWTHEVAHRLIDFCDVVVYAPSKSFRHKVAEHEGVCYQYIPILPERILMKFLEKFLKLPNTKRPFFSSSLYYFGYAVQVARQLKKQKCDIVHIFTFSQFIPIIKFFNPTIKIVLHLQDEFLAKLDLKMLERRLLQVDLIIGCSNYITDKVCKNFPQFSSQCYTVYNGVDINQFAEISLNPKSLSELKDNRVKRLLFVGRVSPEKGIHILLDAFQKIVTYYPQAKLEIVGSTGLLPQDLIVALSDDPIILEIAKKFYSNGWKNYSLKWSDTSATKRHLLKRDTFWKSYLTQWQNHSSIARQVSFIGGVQHSQLVTYYQNADVFILPSVWNEPFGIPIVEAMATGVPVVATKGGGFPEIVEDGKTGLLVERNDANALAEAILRLLSDESLRKSMGKAGHQRSLEHFSWEQITKNLLCQYRRLCMSHQTQSQ
jgi:glycosyltransferase involved in cell wall biosynthesis